MDYSLLVGIHNCDAINQQQPQQPLDLGDGQTADAMASNSDEHESSGSAATPPDSPVTLQPDRVAPSTAELDSCLEFFAIKSAERE